MGEDYDQRRRFTRHQLPYTTTSSLVLLCIRVTRHGEVSRGEVRIPRNDIPLRLGQRIDEVLIHVQRLPHNLRRGQGQPLRRADVGVLGRLEDLHVYQRLISRVLEIVRAADRHVSDVSGLEIERPGIRRSGEHSDATLALQEEIPFIGRQVPVDLTHCSRFNGEESHGEVTGDRKRRWVDDFDGPAGNGQRSLCRQVIAVGFVLGKTAVGSVYAGAGFFERLLCGRAVEDVSLVGGYVVEGADVSLEVLGQNFLGVAEE